MSNIHIETGIPFGYIAAGKLDPDIVSELQENGTDVLYAEAWKNHVDEMRANFDTEQADLLSEAIHNGIDFVGEDFDEEDYRDSFNDKYQPDEPIHEGVKDGVSYRTSWLGGALNVWIFESPYVTYRARRASPCVPGAAILDTLDGSEIGYDVPPWWRDDRSMWVYAMVCHARKIGAIGLPHLQHLSFDSAWELETRDDQLRAGLTDLRRQGFEWMPGNTDIRLVREPDRS